MSRILMILPPLVFAALAAMFWLGMQREDPDALPSTLVGRAAPVVQVGTLGDHPALLHEALTAPGVKLLNFWASWCAPCRAEHPMLKQLQAEGVTILGVNYKDKSDQAEAFLAELGNPYTAIGTDSGRMALEWGVYGVPETFVIDGAGKVVLRYAGPITAQELERVIRPALAKAAK
ncbi:DsbE family thiol:disulfide interchange protein [Gemmobacter sp. LW-1]|uniref:DsbE family thiol:disulfide interchange protein n=1 Tax=Gemmobacter sp. LW-1 TaxID=1529005 RepID=UPI000A9D791F|nr:DsbE family thiol:disulfide interchange protein [Gemmobacter sp. LW-1]